jgi:hypothetical protein
MDYRRIAKTSGPPALAGLAAVMFPTLSPWIGYPLLIGAVALTAYGYWEEVIDGIPWLRRFKRKPMPFRDVVRRVALHSEWGLSYQPAHWPTWQDDLKAEMLWKLSGNDVRSEGIRHEPPEPGDSGPTPIPRLFWSRADFLVEPFLVWDGATMAYQKGDPCPLLYTQISFDRADIDRLWPVVSTRARRGRLSPIAALAREWHEENQPTPETQYLWDEAIKLGE